MWRAARHAIIVNPLLGATSAAHANARVIEQIDERPPLARSLLDSLRVHQWAKNLLVFLPLLTAHRFTDLVGINTCWQRLRRFLSLRRCSIINDLLICRSIECTRQSDITAGVRCLADSICDRGDAGIADRWVCGSDWVSLPLAGMVWSILRSRLRIR